MTNCLLFPSIIFKMFTNVHKISLIPNDVLFKKGKKRKETQRAKKIMIIYKVLSFPALSSKIK